MLNVIYKNIQTQLKHLLVLKYLVTYNCNMQLRHCRECIKYQEEHHYSYNKGLISDCCDCKQERYRSSHPCLFHLQNNYLVFLTMFNVWPMTSMTHLFECKHWFLSHNKWSKLRLTFSCSLNVGRGKSNWYFCCTLPIKV